MRPIEWLYLSVLLLVSTICGAKEPAWILLERGKAAYEARNLTSAMNNILQALESNEDYPEAEYWLGMIYLAQGQIVLAEEQYRRALRSSLFLRVPEDRYTILYSLADLLLQLNKERWREAESILLEIVNSERRMTAENIEREHRYIDTLINSGLDELLYLYRDELRQSLRATRILGENAWNEGRYRSALLNSARAVLSLLSRAAAEARAYDPLWRFDIDPLEDPENPDRDVRYPRITDGVDDMLKKIEDYRPEVMIWLSEAGLWSQIYLLSAALYAEGFTESAQSIWRLLAPIDAPGGQPRPREEAGLWGNLAAKQLAVPFITAGSLVP